MERAADLQRPRVVDYSDLVALAVLPAVWFSARTCRPVIDPPRRIFAAFVGACAIIVFAATSGYSVAPYELDYQFDVSPQELVILADLHPTLRLSDEFRDGDRTVWASGWNAHASVYLTGNDSLTVMHLREIVISNARADSSRLLEDFERQIVQPIRHAIRDDSLMLMVRLANRPDRAGTALDRHTRVRAPFTGGIGKLYEAGDRRLILTVGNYSGDDVGYDPCTIRAGSVRWASLGGPRARARSMRRHRDDSPE